MSKNKKVDLKVVKPQLEIAVENAECSIVAKATTLTPKPPVVKK